MNILKFKQALKKQFFTINSDDEDTYDKETEDETYYDDEDGDGDVKDDE